MITLKSQRARDRIEKMGFTQEQIDFIFADWNEGERHYQWLLRAKKEEIIDWGEVTNWGRGEESE